MSRPASPPLEKLVTLFTHARRGAFAIALYDRLAVRRDITTALRERLAQPVYEVVLSEQERNPTDLIRALQPKPAEVVCLYDLERALPQALGYLDLQREVLVEMDIALLCWVTAFGHRMLAQQAPNFYAFRTTVCDFTTAESQPPTASLFIGRRRELKKLTALLPAGGLVLLTGQGGIGKTTLAQQAVQPTRAHWSGGTAWVNCATRPPLDDILLTAAVALIGDVMQQCRADERQQRLAEALRERPCLLVLDNFETIAEDSAVLRWLQTISAPSTALLVSRQRVPSLRVPTLRLSTLSTNDAVRLFTQRARHAGWEGTDAAGLPRLCALVGNLPLAIALLAPRAAELPLPVLEDVLQHHSAALANDTDLTLAEDQQRIAACFLVSFDLLSEGARVLLTRLSLLPDGLEERFVAPFTTIAEWHQPLAECRRYALLSLEQQRYRFHPLVHSIALAQLGDALHEWQRRFVAFFRQLLLDNHDINDRDQRAVLDAEWRNALAAAETAEALQDWDTVGTLSAWLGDFLLLRGRWVEREHLNQRALAASRLAGDRQAEAGGLNNLGIVYWHQGRWADAEAAYQQSLALCRELGERHGEGQTLNSLGIVYWHQGRWAEAEVVFQHSLAIRRELGDRHGEGQTLTNLGIVYKDQGRWAEAEACYQHSLAIRRELGDRHGEGQTLNNLGLVYQDQGRWADAEAAYQQSLALCRELGERHGEGNTLANLALLRQAQGDKTEALRLAREALRVFEATEDEAAQEKVRQLVAAWEPQAQ